MDGVNNGVLVVVSFSLLWVHELRRGGGLVALTRVFSVLVQVVEGSSLLPPGTLTQVRRALYSFARVHLFPVAIRAADGSAPTCFWGVAPASAIANPKACECWRVVGVLTRALVGAVLRDTPSH